VVQANSRPGYSAGHPRLCVAGFSGPGISSIAGVKKNKDDNLKKWQLNDRKRQCIGWRTSARITFPIIINLYIWCIHMWLGLVARRKCTTSSLFLIIKFRLTNRCSPSVLELTAVMASYANCLP